MKKLLIVAFAALAAVTVVAQEAELKKIAVFVQNRTRVAGMDDEIDGIKDRLASSLAEVEGLSVVDSALTADTFRRYKVTTEEEKAGLVSGIFSGGSAPRIAQMLDCDYVMAASIVRASAMNRKIDERPSTVFSLTATLKVTDRRGRSLDGLPTWTRTFPVLEPQDDPMNYYSILIDKWVADMVAAVSAKAPKWKAAAPSAALAKIRVTTTVDKVVTELESQTKGVQGERLAELRRVVGGAAVEVDGAVIGSAPGEFMLEPGLHQIKVTRDWMKPYAATVSVTDGMVLDVALELSNEGIAKWSTVEAVRADMARRYAEAAMSRGIKVNLDTANWRDVGGSGPAQKIVIEK